MEPFGVGHVYVKPPGSTWPDYVEALIMQDCSWDFKFDTKELHGAYQFPVSVRRAKGVIDGTAKYAHIRPDLVAPIFNADDTTIATGQDQVDELNVDVATHAASITIPNSGTLVEMIGVWYTDAGGNLMLKRVDAGPAAGEYTVSAVGSAITMGFESGGADDGKTLRVVYRYNHTAYGKKIPLVNYQMGQTPLYGGGIFVNNDGDKQMVLVLNRVVINGWKFATKIDDFTFADLPLKAYADNEL